MLETLRQDARLAGRAMVRNPAFSLTAVLSLALAIGGNTAVFTIVRAVLLKPLDYPNAGRLISFSSGATPSRFELTRSSARSFSRLAAHVGPEALTLSGGSEPEVLNAVRISAGFL